MLFIIFPFLYFQVFDLFKNTLEKKSLNDARTIANQTFNSMFQVMKRGWSRKDLLEFLNNTKLSQKEYQINIYRTDIVEKLFGKIEQPKFDKEIFKAINEKKELSFTENGNLRFIMPVKAQEVCLRCHTNANVGDVLGIVEVKSNLKEITSSVQKDFSKTLILIFPIPLISVLLIGYILTNKIRQELNKLKELTENISKMEDLEKIKQININFPFEEFNEVYANIYEIITKLSKIAVDKEVLEFEIKLLEKFILTSEVVKDWKEYVITLLIEINKIIPIFIFFSIFKELDRYEAEIFWLGTPSEAVKHKFEEIVKQKLKGSFHLEEYGYIEINHNIAEKEIFIADNVLEGIEYRTKSLILERPQIGGIVGIGASSETTKNEAHILVIESILSTFLNVVGSVKAIYKYTKDLEYYATRDPLTNLYNQRVFWELIDYESKRAKRHNYSFSLLVIDLDNFKTVNDTYGHDFGDKFLVEVANLLENSVRPSDIVSMYGGDEFVIILPETNGEGAYIVAQRILKNAEKYFIQTPDSKTINPRFSIGISTYPEHTDNIKDLFSLADNMMYKAKSSGKYQAKLPTEDDILEFFKQESQMNIYLIEAINNKKIIPYFQPVLDVEKGKIYAYELLSRIEYNNEIIPASKFIEIAEKTGMIFKMDLILIEKAFEKFKNRDEKLFINLSPKALISSEYLLKIKEIVNQYGINPNNLVFEITERDTVRNFSLLQKFVFELKDAGFKFAIDDFGSGFSSFYYVKQFPVDFVKIEGEFIKNVITDEKDKAFVESIITLSQKLGIKTIAEFVEDETILDAVKKMQINYAQGYYIGKPSPSLN